MSGLVLKKGEKVAWESGAQGTFTVKQGVIAMVVPPNVPPLGLIKAAKNLKGYVFRNSMAARDHRSYLVIEGKTETSKGRLMWPVAKSLKLVV
jgi:hypothetical protein